MVRDFLKLVLVGSVLGLLSACTGIQTGSLGPVGLSISDDPLPNEAESGHFLPTQTALTAQPTGFIGFCIRFPDQCTAPADAPSNIALNQQNWALLNNTNYQFNRAIFPEDDMKHYGVAEYWTIPTDGYGDCEDIALAKRKSLIQQGLPAPALRIAVVNAPGFGSHAVLTVATDKGDYVLDSMAQQVLAWDKTGLTWIERQDPKNILQWVSLQPAGRMMANASSQAPTGQTPAAR